MKAGVVLGSFQVNTSKSSTWILFPKHRQAGWISYYIREGSRVENPTLNESPEFIMEVGGAKTAETSQCQERRKKAESTLKSPDALRPTGLRITDIPGPRLESAPEKTDTTSH